MTEENRTLPHLAATIAQYFEELEGRAVAVSEVDPFDKNTNIPSLPIAVVALVGEQGTGRNTLELVDDVLVQFVFHPVKYKRADGNDSPFFAFYDYEDLRDRFIAMLQNYTSPKGARFYYRSLDVESDEYAVYIAIRLTGELSWCLPEHLAPQPNPAGFTVGLRMQPPPSKCAPTECPALPDPCDAARRENPHGRESWTEEEAANHGPITE
jgi:hypothetical protein